MTYRIAYNRSSNHIDGIEARTQSTGSDLGDRVAYYAESACGALTRGSFAYSTPEVDDADDMSQVLAATELNAAIGGRKMCKKCAAAAQEIIAQQQA